MPRPVPVPGASPFRSTERGAAMKDAVRDRFHAFSTPFEGRRYHMYRDVKGKVTVGVGNLIDSNDSPDEAIKLPFKPNGVGATASEKDIGDAWKAVKAAPPGLQTSQSGKDPYGKL